MSLELRKSQKPPENSIGISKGNEFITYNVDVKKDYNLNITNDEIMELLHLKNIDKNVIDEFVKMKEKDIQNKILKSKNKCVEGQDIFPLPNLSGRDTIAVIGQSGAGKSTWIKKFVKLYKQLYPKRKAYLISSKEKDPSLDDVKLKRIIINEESCKLLDWNFFKKSILIIDDSFFETEEQKCINKLMSDILQLGRQDKISLIVSKHILNNGMDTKLLKCECSMIVMFPNHSPRNHIINYLKMNGFKNKEIEDILATDSRYVAVRIQHPHVIFSSNNVKLY